MIGDLSKTDGASLKEGFNSSLLNHPPAKVRSVCLNYWLVTGSPHPVLQEKAESVILSQSKSFTPETVVHGPYYKYSLLMSQSCAVFFVLEFGEPFSRKFEPQYHPAIRLGRVGH